MLGREKWILSLMLASHSITWITLFITVAVVTAALDGFSPGQVLELKEGKVDYAKRHSDCISCKEVFCSRIFSYCLLSTSILPM